MPSTWAPPNTKSARRLTPLLPPTDRNASGPSPRPPRTGVVPCIILVPESLEPSALEALALGPPQPRSNPVGEVCTRNLTAIPWMKFAPATSSRQTLEKCKPCSPELGCALAAAPRLATSPCPAGHSAPACCPARWVRRVSMTGEAVLTARPTSSVGHHHPAMAFLLPSFRSSRKHPLTGGLRGRHGIQHTLTLPSRFPPGLQPKHHSKAVRCVDGKQNI